jgi:hypothetical protein
MIIHASKMTSERCCYITGLLDMAKAAALKSNDVAVIMDKLGVTVEEVQHECVGTSRGVVSRDASK